jgi:hypothetical protein
MMLDPGALRLEDASGTARAGLNRGFLHGDELRADFCQGPCLFRVHRAGQAAASKGSCGGKAPNGNISLISRARSRSRRTPAR